MVIQLDLQILRLYSTGTGKLFPTAIAQAREAKLAGFSPVFIMGHFNPTLPAKVITTLNMVSHNRVVLGSSTSWLKLEYGQLGFKFDTFTDKLNSIDETIQINLPRIKSEQPKILHADATTPTRRWPIPTSVTTFHS